MRAIKSVDKSLANNTSFLKNKSNLEVNDINRNHFNVYSNLHKNSTKARFIIAAPKCSVKPFLKAATASLKPIYKQTGN